MPNGIAPSDKLKKKYDIATSDPMLALRNASSIGADKLPVTLGMMPSPSPSFVTWLGMGGKNPDVVQNLMGAAQSMGARQLIDYLKKYFQQK